MLGTKIDQNHWAFPEKTTLQGQYVTLEPLSLNHLSDLWAEAKSAPDSFSYLRYGPFETADTLRVLLTDLSSRTDQPFWAVIDSTGSARGLLFPRAGCYRFAMWIKMLVRLRLAAFGLL